MKRAFRAFFMGLGMFTALPCPYRPWEEEDRGLMLVCLPMVGAVIGLLWAALALAGRLLLAPSLAAVLTLALPLLMTGFIHLDGFMDTCDALLSWRPLEERLRILKDSRTGAFAVISLALLLLLGYASASGIDAGDARALLFIPIISRCGSAFCVLTLKPIGHSEYSKLTGTAAQRMAVVAIWLAALIACWIWLGNRAVVLIVETLAYAAAMLWAARTLGGVSGDLAGFALSIAEIFALAALANLHMAA